jgi:hypothetical protein
MLQGWQHERVAAKISSKGDRIIYVVPGDPPRHLYKVLFLQSSLASQLLDFLKQLPNLK